MCFKSEEDVDHLLKVNPLIRVGGKRVSFARAQNQGGAVSHDVEGKSKAPMVRCSQTY